nr:aminoacetone oxidase family FAD-binding enzyme [Candidatus Omnitrophota bacterium]
MRIKKIIVVGGGPAGMMAAIRAAQLKQPVTLVEKNPALGKKLLLSGKGRCNLTNSCDLDSFLQRFSGNAQFLRDAFKKFFNRQLMDFFQDRGLRLRVERQQRVFPATDKSDSVLQVLKKELERLKVNILYKRCLEDIIIRDGQVKGVKLSGGEIIPAEKIILATGGVSYGFTGSTGEGLKLTEKSGHCVTPLKAGLVALRVKEKYPAHLKGLTLKNIRLKFSDGKKKITSAIGELLFTDKGISGPLVLTLSGRVLDWSGRNQNVFAEIDLKPGLSAEQLDNRLLREFKAGPKKSLKKALKKLLPQRLVDLFTEICAIAPDKSAAHITKSERGKISLLLKGLRMNISGSEGIGQAMVT